MSEEKELQESDFSEVGADDLENLMDFTDLADLENVDDMDVFGELGDIADLGDVPDISGLGQKSDISAEENSAQEMPELSEEMPELSMDDMSLGEIPELPEEDTLEELSVEDMPELSVDDLLGEDIPDMLSMDDLSTEEMPELSMDNLPEEDASGELSMDDLSTEEMPELSMDNLPEEDASGELSMDDLSTEEMPELSMDNLPEEDASGELSIDDLSTEEMSELSMDDLSVGDSVSDAMGLEEPDMNSVMPEEMALDDMNITEDGLLENLDIDFGALEEPPAEDSSAEEGLGNMLDGLLDDLDMNGAIEDASGQEGTEPQDDMADLLGLDDSLLSGEEEDTAADDLSLDMLDASGIIPEETTKQEKEPGFFKRVFGNIVTDEIAEKEREAAKKEEEEAEQQAEEAAKEKEEREAQKAEKKAEKEAKAAEKKKEKEAKKAEKAQRKAEKKAKEEEEAAAELEIIGKLNKVGVSIIVIATILFLAIEITGTNVFSYISAKNEAMDYFEMGKYTEAYKAAVGTDMRDKDSEEYDKIKTVMKVQQCLNAYQNYDRIKYYPEALDALLRGVKRYDANIEKGTQLEVEKDMMSCRKQIISLLQSQFNISETKAYSLLALEKEDYQNEVIKIGLEKVK